jgi:cytochrome c-type biogenesis protein
MQQIIEALSSGLNASPAVALAAAFGWGLASVLLSPCHLASIPLIVGFIDDQGRTSTRRAFWLSAAFAGGILLTIALIGVITASLGRMMGDVGAWGNYIVAAVFFLVGLHLLDVIPMPFGGASVDRSKRKGLLAALILGLVFGIALGPCTFAYMAPMLAVTLKVGATQFVYAASLLLAYGIGHCSVIVAAGTSMEAVQGYLDWTERSRGTVIVKRVCGALVVAAGLYMLYIA